MDTKLTALENYHKNIEDNTVKLLHSLTSEMNIKNIQDVLFSGYTRIVSDINGLVEMYKSQRTTRDESIRLSEQAANVITTAGTDVLNIDYLAKAAYDDGLLVDNFKKNLIMNITSLNARWNTSDYTPKINDIETIKDLSTFLYSVLKTQLTETPGTTKQDNNNSAAANRKSIDTLFAMTQADLYTQFSGDSISNLSKKPEKEKRSFEANARAYQFTNEPMAALYDELRLDLTDATMLCITCSGDPIGMFYGLGVKRMVAFDTSHKATLYGEFKAASIANLSYEEFCKFYNIDSCEDMMFEDNVEKDNALQQNISKNNVSLYQKVRPNLTKAAQIAFDGAFKRSGNENSMFEVYDDAIIFRDKGYASPCPESNLYTQSEKHYLQAQSGLKNHMPKLIPGGLSELMSNFDLQNSFDAIYLSNAPDHFRDSNGKLEPGEEVFRPFYTMLDKLTTGTGSKIIFNFQWSKPVEATSEKILEDLGYSYKITHNGSGCGHMAVAEKK